MFYVDWRSHICRYSIEPNRLRPNRSRRESKRPKRNLRLPTAIETSSPIAKRLQQTAGIMSIVQLSTMSMMLTWRLNLPSCTILWPTSLRRISQISFPERSRRRSRKSEESRTPFNRWKWLFPQTSWAISRKDRQYKQAKQSEHRNLPSKLPLQASSKLNKTAGSANPEKCESNWQHQPSDDLPPLWYD